jgi:hypothetical protein
MNPPLPRVWFGLAFFLGVAATFVITRTFDNWTQLVPVPENVPIGTRRVLLTMEILVIGVAIQAVWWSVRNTLRRRAPRS